MKEVVAGVCRSASVERGTESSRTPRERTVTSLVGSQCVSRLSDHTHLHTHNVHTTIVSIKCFFTIIVLYWKDWNTLPLEVCQSLHFLPTFKNR